MACIISPLGGVAWALLCRSILVSRSSRMIGWASTRIDAAVRCTSNESDVTGAWASHPL